MFSIRFVDKIFALLNFALATFGFVYHFTEDWVIALVVSSNVLFVTGILMGIRHEKELKDFEKSVSDYFHRIKMNRRGAYYARKVQGK